MKPENLNMDEITDARRKAFAASIRIIDVEELKKLGEKLFPFVDHPWREVFFGFLSQHPGSTFRHATANDGVQIVYCHDEERGMWFVPGTGMGPLQTKGLAVLKQIVESR